MSEAAPAPAESTDPAATVGLVVLVARGVKLALRAEAVLTIREMAPPTALPHAPPYLLGLVRAGEHALPLVDLGAFLQLEIDPARGVSEPPMRIVEVGIGSMHVGLCCQRVAAVRRVDQHELRPPEAVRGAVLGALLEAEVVLPDGPVGLLDCAVLLEAARPRPA